MTREEAIKEAYGIPVTKAQHEALQFLIPELRESEDERIRKECISIIKHYGHICEEDGDPCPTIGACLAYLEKQKDIKVKYVYPKFRIGDVISYNKPEPGFINDYTIVGFNNELPDYLVDGGNVPSCSIGIEFIDSNYHLKEQKPVVPSDDELQRHQDELYDFKVFAAKQAKEHHISFVHDFEWNNFCAGILSYFNEQRPADLPPGFYFIDLDGKKDYSKEFRYGDMKMKIVEDKSEKPAEWDELQAEFRSINEAFEDGKKEVVEHPKKYGLCKLAEWSEVENEMEKINVFRPLAGTSIESATKQAVNKFTNSGKKFLLAFNGVFILIDNTKSVQDIVSEYNRSLGGKEKGQGQSEGEPNDFEITLNDCMLAAQQYPQGKIGGDVVKKWAEELIELCPQQKPVEWTEDDEEHLKWLCRIIHSRKVHGELSLKEESELGQWIDRWINHSPQPKWDEFDEDCLKRAIWYVENPAPSVIKDSRLALWLNTLRSRFFLKPQPKADWSEEDLQHRSWILECLADGERKMPEYAEDFRAAYRWFKSLRPSWKPSEEQMDALDIVLEHEAERVGSSNELEKANALYEQLKKLM